MLNWVGANRLPKVGRCNLTHLLTPAGKPYTEVTIAKVGEEEFYVVSFPEQEQHDFRWLEMHRAQNPEWRDVVIENVTAEIGCLMLNGPASRDILKKFAPATDWDGFKFYEFEDVEVCGVRARAMQVSFTGELGWEFHVYGAAETAELYEKLMAAEPRLVDWGGTAMGSYRLEKGIRAAGTDFTKDHCALEAGLGRFIRFDEKDFVGKEALLKKRAQGPPAQTSELFEVHGTEQLDCVGNEPLYERGTDKVVGFTTSGGFGYITQKSIAFGYVLREARNKPLSVALLGERYDVTLREEGAFMDPALKRERLEKERAAKQVVVEVGVEAKERSTAKM